MEATAHIALAHGSRLMEYRLVAVLGAGAFGVTYLARDLNLEMDVALKEYLPRGIAIRTEEGVVTPVAPDQAQAFHWGLDRFIKEARTLAAFSHPHVLRVHRYFEANGTAYMVMDYERGESLTAFVRRRGAVPEAELEALVGPLLDGLEKVHDAGFLHRDIKPDNIVVRKRGGLVLIDFGSAREAIRGADQAPMTVVSPGYAPCEQYSETNEQGPWTDIYALGGVLYFAVTGQRPPDSLTRLKSDTLGPALGAARQRYSAPFIDAIAWALALDDGARPRSVPAWRAGLLAANAPGAKGLRAADPTATARIGHNLLSESGDQTVRMEHGFGGSIASPPYIHITQRIATQALSSATIANVPASAARDWTWIVKYLAVVLLALVLAAVFDGMELFKNAVIVRKQLTAAHLVKFAGYASALAVLWLLADRLAAQLRDQGGRGAFLHHFPLPLATLLVVPSAYAALLPIVGPFMDSTHQSLFNWAFVVGTIAAAGWFVSSFFRDSDSPAVSAHGETADVQSVLRSSVRRCAACGFANPGGANFCQQCGASRAAARALDNYA